ncbi:putative O-antigen biosynthesis glycosyltransferase [Halobacteriovorax marinus SJ]|uniref:O-antigen biosynthesis glycosyltransferase n=1 Tax=Halobacteriovorax marinus (strain ATCC BAA-682 / DSM 15412 / SJ) TaxID=862908 RepID=E1X3G8_HALMS|nr:glycosyltransferase family 4 protein [Halobacteriovorax marinus]CBW25263.1 putative O-antigen biosynthesis glycosyltransferase [Halobacteriovorax marinus SJ]
MKKILFFVNPLAFFISHRLPIARKAIELGYEVHVASGTTEGKDLLLEEGIGFHYIPLSRSGMHMLEELKSIFSIFRLYKRLSPDIVHHVTIKPILYGTLAARMNRIPLIVNAFTGLGYIFTQKGFISYVRRLIVIGLYKLILKKDGILSIFQNMDDMRYMSSLNIIKKKNSFLIRGSGVDLEKFSYVEEDNNGPCRVILASRLLRDKGVLEFVEAALLLKNKRADVRMILVGEVDEGNPSAISRTELESWVKEGRVEWWGYRSDMNTVLASANIVCLPSYREGLPKVLIEACAIGRAIVTTDVPGCREILSNNHSNALLVESRRVLPLLDAIEVLVDDFNLRVSMGLAGRKLAEEEFSICKVVSETVKIYQSSNSI